MSNANLKDLDILKDLYADLVSGKIPDAITMSNSRQALNRLDTNLSKQESQIYNYKMLINSNYSAGVAYTRGMVKLAVQYTLTSTLETKLHAKLQSQIDGEVRKFWQAMENIKS